MLLHFTWFTKPNTDKNREIKESKITVNGSESYAKTDLLYSNTIHNTQKPFRMEKKNLFNFLVFFGLLLLFRPMQIEYFIYPSGVWFIICSTLAIRYLNFVQMNTEKIFFGWKHSDWILTENGNRKNALPSRFAPSSTIIMLNCRHEKYSKTFYGYSKMHRHTHYSTTTNCNDGKK